MSGALCRDCGTTEFRYVDHANDRARLDCPRGHEFPTAEPMTEAGRRADAALRERAARSATWPGGEPASVREAADDPLAALGWSLFERILDFGRRRGEDAMLAVLRVHLALADGLLVEDAATALMVRIRDGEHMAVLEEMAAEK
ncbi:hypothetical protein ACQPZ8_37510 [Actinomadura nitritigenes]|uniref:hypothetical protein n=1 Tax=Actinomadura nitritigenes TaxID=134602 RepID=UPI003D8F82AA